MPQSLTSQAVQKPSREADAFAVLGELARRGGLALRELESWHRKVEHAQDRGYPLSVIEHSVLVYAIRSPWLGNGSCLGQEICDTLSKSWVELAGKVPSQLDRRLPRSVLRRERHEIQQFHAAAFQNASPQNAHLEIALGKDFIGRSTDLAWAAAAIVLLWSPTARQALGGLALGYTIATTLEFGFHGLLAHAPLPIERFFAWLGGKTAHELKELQFSHVRIHHEKTFRASYHVQFASLAERQAVDRLVWSRGHRAGMDIFESRYGNAISPRGFKKGLVIGLPLSILLTCGVNLAAQRMGFHPTLAFNLMTVLTSMLNLPATGYFHAYMHMSRDEALAASGPVLRWFLRSRYTAMISRLHYGHHRGRGGNFNLLFGADALFGTLRKPTVKQLLEMRELGLFY